MNTHMATLAMYAKKTLKVAIKGGNVANLGNVRKYIIINIIYMNVAKVATILVCSWILQILKTANLKNTWLPETTFGHLQSNKRSRKEARLLPLNDSNIASQTPGGAVSHKDE